MSNSDRIAMAEDLARISTDLSALLSRREAIPPPVFQIRYQELSEARKRLEANIELDWERELAAGSAEMVH